MILLQCLGGVVLLQGLGGVVLLQGVAGVLTHLVRFRGVGALVLGFCIDRSGFPVIKGTPDWAGREAVLTSAVLCIRLLGSRQGAWHPTR